MTNKDFLRRNRLAIMMLPALAFLLTGCASSNLKFYRCTVTLDSVRVVDATGKAIVAPVANGRYSDDCLAISFPERTYCYGSRLRLGERIAPSSYFWDARSNTWNVWQPVDTLYVDLRNTAPARLLVHTDSIVYTSSDGQAVWLIDAYQSTQAPSNSHLRKLLQNTAYWSLLEKAGVPTVHAILPGAFYPLRIDAGTAWVPALQSGITPKLPAAIGIPITVAGKAREYILSFRLSAPELIKDKNILQIKHPSPKAGF